MARIIITDTGGLTAEHGVETLRAAGHDVAVFEAASAADIATEIAEADALIVGYVRIGATDISSAPSLRVIATTTTGLDQIDVEAAGAAGIAVHPLPSPASEEVATHAMAGMLTLLRELPAAQDAARNGWDFTQIPTPPRISELSLGLYGLGRIARNLVERAQPLFARVVAFDPYLPAEDWPVGVDRVNELDDLFAASNVLSLHAPATAENRHAVNERTLSLLPVGAYLVNVARGELVDAAAVRAALDAGTLRGAFLDVFDPEPPTADEPLLSHPRAIVTPHAAFYSTTTDRAYMGIAVENVLAALAESGASGLRAGGTAR
jgi:D-3-phosphoglycerate dehydrogenase